MKTQTTPHAYARRTPETVTGTVLLALGFTVVVALLGLAAMYPLLAVGAIATTFLARTVARALLAVRRTRRVRTDASEGPVRH